MSELNPREHELVALGAAIASNCVPCVEHHLAAARKAGLTDLQIRAAVELADEVRRVPARKVLAAAALVLGDDEAPIGDATETQPCADLGKSMEKRCC